MSKKIWATGFSDGSGKERILKNGEMVATTNWGCGCCASDPSKEEIGVAEDIVKACNEYESLQSQLAKARKIFKEIVDPNLTVGNTLFYIEIEKFLAETEVKP